MIQLSVISVYIGQRNVSSQSGCVVLLSLTTCLQRSRESSRSGTDNVEIGLLQLGHVLAGLPLATIAPLQRVQNATARLIFELGTVTASLLQLHWRPIPLLAGPV